MKYVNREMKIDQIIGYFNDKKINLIPPFQRGSVWTPLLRRKLIENMVQARPIPAVFLYKQEDEGGDQFGYNILDGKQRLESLLLFIGDQRQGMKVNKLEHYFYGLPAYEDRNFAINLAGKEVTFKNLDNALVRQLREYPIPTIEIDLDDENAHFSEVVDLFIDINQYGVKVSRFHMVRALTKDKLFTQVFRMFARRENKKRSSYYRAIPNSYTYVMKQLNIIKKLSDQNSQVDRMWERLTEIALFSRSKMHRAPAGILKSFINQTSEPNPRLGKAELTKLRTVFGFLASAYRKYEVLRSSSFATDQPQAYTLITTLLSRDLMDTYTDLDRRLLEVAKMIEGVTALTAKQKRLLADYKTASTKQTTHPSQRNTRQKILMQLIKQCD